MSEETAVEVVACRSCGAPIWWGLTKNSKRCPFDMDGDQPTTTSHFATCPDAKRWTRKTRQP